MRLDMRLKSNILITGLPGVGKTTLIVRLLDVLKDRHSVGFYTKEIRSGGTRKGFELFDLNGRMRVLSHVNIKSHFRVGKYGVDVEGFEDFLDLLDFFDPATDLIVIDEIGKMECFSVKFKTLIEKIMDSEKSVIATIARKGARVIEQIKRRDDIRLFEVTQDNRDRLVKDISFLITAKQ
jgi:nucleoside-triphosphatase